MEDKEIFKKINDVVEVLVEEDIDEWLVPELSKYYDEFLTRLAPKAYDYGYNCPAVAISAFKEQAKAQMHSALKTFFFKAEHWRSGRDLNPYLLTVFYRLKDRIRWESETSKKTSVQVCPGCKSLQKREYLTLSSDDSFLKCKECSTQLELIEEEIKLEKNANILNVLNGRKRLFKAFHSHTRKGYRCPDCYNFIPESCNGTYGISCPYPGCHFFGSIDELEQMLHPSALVRRIDDSIHAYVCASSDGGKGIELQDMIKSSGVDSAFDIFSVNESFKAEKELLLSTLAEQKSQVMRTNSQGTLLQKALMYDAYTNMVNINPDDMINYLIKGKKCEDYPIQSRIFQEYVSLMYDALPYVITKAGKSYEINSLLDPNLTLFEGISVFDATVRSNYTIPNNTIEQYVGGRKFKSYGPCFIGYVIDVTNKETGLSVKSCIKKYSFVDIEFNHESVVVGTPVVVKHYRIPSHYEMGALTYLQRARKKIVASIQKKLEKINCNQF
jgi:hypothetical protein